MMTVTNCCCGCYSLFVPSLHLQSDQGVVIGHRSNRTLFYVASHQRMGLTRV